MTARPDAPTGVTEAGVTEAGVTEAGVTEAGVTEAGVTEAGVTEAVRAEVVRAEVVRAEVVRAEVVRAEVVRHHQVIERWLAGTAPRASFGRFADAHAPGFTLAGPDGRLLSRAEVLAEVAAAYGRVPGARIEIRAVTVVATAPGLVVARYDEWQHAAGRRATVVLERGRAGLRWLHLHETWLTG